MKTVRIILAVVAVSFLANSVIHAQNTREQEVVFSVNIDCHSCEQKIKRNLERARGVRELTTSLEKQLVTIKFRTNQTSKDRLKKAIEDLGFTCEEVKPNA